MRGIALFCSALAAITGRPVEPSDSGTGTMLGALMTATGKLPKREREQTVAAPFEHPAFRSYAQEWRRAADPVARRRRLLL